MTGKTKMVRDALGSPVPQTLNSDGTYSVLASGNTNGIDFSKHKMLRDAMGSPLPYQYFDVTENKFVAGTIGGSGTGAVDSVNGKTGNVNLTASDLGAASEADLSNIEQSVQDLNDVVATHLDEMASFTKTILITEPYNQLAKTTIDLGFQPNFVIIQATILQTSINSTGTMSDNGTQNCSLWSADNVADILGNNIIVFRTTGGNSNDSIVGNATITSNRLEINWTQYGTLTSVGNRRLIISAFRKVGV